MLKFMYPKEIYISTILLNGRTYARTTKYNPIITQDINKAILVRFVLNAFFFITKYHP